MRWIIRLIWIAVVAGAIFAAGLFLVPNEQVARLLENQIEAATGREVTFEGSVRPSIYPNIGLRTGPVRIANASWSEGGPILEADGLNVALDLRGLLAGDLLIGDITAISPRLLLETNSEGEANWMVFENAGTSEAAQEAPVDAPKRKISLDNLSLTDAAVRFVDRRSGENVAISNIDVNLNTPEIEGPTEFAITYRRAGQPIEITGRIAETEAFLNGASTGTAATVKAAGSQVVFDGSAALDGSAAGRLSARVAQTSSLLTTFGLPGADLPKGFGRSGTFSAQMKYGANNIVSLSGLNADLEGNRFQGDLTVNFGGKPKVTGSIAASALDLSAFAGAGGGSASSGWSTSAIDMSALGALDADLGFSTPGITFGDIRLTDIAAQVVIDRARGVLTLNRAAGYGGAIKGTFVANNRDGLSVRADTTASGVQMRALLSSLMGYERLSGSGNARLSVLGVGNSVDAIMRSLDGDGSVAISRGEITGLKFATLFLNQGASGGSTIFNDLTGSFTITNGVLSNKDLTASLEQFGAKGAGKIDLGGQAIDYRVTPVLPKTKDGREIVFPVAIKGPWASPKVSVDLEAAIKQTFEAEIEAEKAKVREKVQEEVKKVEDKARAKVDEKLKEELGVDRDADESVEDAVRRTIEQEAVKGLRNLLGR